MVSPLTPLDRLRDQIRAQREAVVKKLREHLSALDPYQFEHLIRDLLEKMSFRDCQVTQQYKDGGIDLTASFSIGITEIRTLCQVKRQRAPIGIPVLQWTQSGCPRSRTSPSTTHPGSTACNATSYSGGG